MRWLEAEMKRAWGRPELVPQNGPEVLGSAQMLYCRYCDRGRESCCEAGCRVFLDLVFGWRIGICPDLGRIVEEEEREDYFDLLIDPCRYCPRRRSHIDPVSWRRVGPSCSGTRSGRFGRLLLGIGHGRGPRLAHFAGTSRDPALIGGSD